MNFKVKSYLKKLDPEFKQIFKNKKDPYAFLASKIFHVPYQECSPFELYESKTLRYCKCPSAKGQRYRLCAKFLVLAAVYPKKVNLIDTIQECERTYKLKLEEAV